MGVLAKLRGLHSTIGYIIVMTELQQKQQKLFEVSIYFEGIIKVSYELYLSISTLSQY